MTATNEKLGTITRADGRRFDVFLLKVRDLRGLNFQAPDFPLDLAAAALQIPRAEFDEWDFNDASKVMDLLGKGIERLGKL